ncbi:hypothetical protein DRP04_03190 [Archaeoglobales archaeon]|nr:MAG: hypothetical protein DRP04_03190 [Archaeoglobales archaeon]
MVEILQLKPKENAFYKMARNVIRRKLDAIFVCEGRRDSEVLKGLISKIRIVESNLAVTDCEGKDAISEVTMYIATLASVSRTLKAVSIIIDADEYAPADRARSILNSLRSRISDVELIEIDRDIFEIRSQAFKVRIFAKVVGDFGLPYERHMIDDYVLRLLLLEELIEEEETRRYNSAKEFVNEFIESSSTTIKELILNAQPESVQNAFGNLIKYLKIVGIRARGS